MNVEPGVEHREEVLFHVRVVRGGARACVEKGERVNPYIPIHAYIQPHGRARLFRSLLILTRSILFLLNWMGAKLEMP